MTEKPMKKRICSYLLWICCKTSAISVLLWCLNSTLPADAFTSTENKTKKAPTCFPTAIRPDVGTKPRFLVSWIANVSWFFSVFSFNWKFNIWTQQLKQLIFYVVWIQYWYYLEWMKIKEDRKLFQSNLRVLLFRTSIQRLSPNSPFLT